MTTGAIIRPSLDAREGIVVSGPGWVRSGPAENRDRRWAASVAACPCRP